MLRGAALFLFFFSAFGRALSATPPQVPPVVKVGETPAGAPVSRAEKIKTSEVKPTENPPGSPPEMLLPPGNVAVPRDVLVQALFYLADRPGPATLIYNGISKASEGKPMACSSPAKQPEKTQ